MEAWRVLLLDTKRSNPNHYICLAIERALRANSQVESVLRVGYADAMPAALAGRCNLFLAFDGEELDSEIGARLAEVCGASAMWVTEDPYELATNLGNAHLFDLIFSNDSASVAAYGAKGRHLPFAADPGLHQHPIPASDQETEHYRYDLFFAGTAWPNRVELLRKLQSRIEDVNLKLALPHNPHIPAPDLGLDPSSYLWRTPNSEFARFANRSRAVLTLHRSFSSSGNDPMASTPGPRLFEVALAGGFQLVDMSIPRIEVTRYFDEGSEFIGFRSADECSDKLAYYLAKGEERLAIARAAQNRALSEHLYAHRVDYLLSQVVALPSRVLRADTVEARRPRVLFVTHNIVGVQPYGGIEIYQDLIRKGLGDRFETFFYVPDRNVRPLGKRCVLYNEQLQYLEDHEFNHDISDADLSCPEREKAFSSLLARHRIDLVHFQHLIGHTPSLTYVPKVLGIPSVISLHDYYAICSHFNLIGYKGRYCNVPALPKVSCDICLNAVDSLASGSQAQRRAFFARALDQVDIYHVNTAGVAELFGQIYPNLISSVKMRVFAVPMPNGSSASPSPPNTRSVNPLRIAILGNFTRNKGADEIIHAVNQMRQDPVEFTIFGALDEPYGTLLRTLCFQNVHVHGAYEPGTLGSALSTFSISLHLSIWPETYCITLSEAWQAGLVPIVSNTGALGERVTHGVNGFKVAPDEAGAVVAMLRQLIAEPERIDKARDGINHGLYVTIEEHITWLSGLYDDLRHQACASTVKRHAKNWNGLSLLDLGIPLNNRIWKRYHAGMHVAATASGSALTVVGSASILGRAIGYAWRHGVRAMVRRVVREVLVRAKLRGAR